MKTHNSSSPKLKATVEEYEASGDLGFRAEGPDLPSVVAAVAQSLISALVPLEIIHERETRSLEISGEDEEEQVINFLNEVLFLVFGHRWLPRKVESLIWGETLKAELIGEPLDPQRHHIEREIKAVTYHNLLIIRTRNSVTIDILCDL
jgi:SHS2 domain-containing protein